jgi:serine/threonine protein kinase
MVMMCKGIFGTKNSRTKVSISRDDIQELDSSKHSRDEPASEPPSPLPSRRLRMSKEGLAHVRGADAQLVTEVLQLNFDEVNFDELQKPMKYLGSGEFCEALLTKLDGKDVVVKMLKQEQQNNPTAVMDLLSEGALMLTMRHKNILAGIAHGLDDHGLPFVVIEKLESVLSAELPKSADSVPFWTRSAQVKKWPMTRALRVGMELAEALHYCHAEGRLNAFPGCRILHRDLKPNNIGFLPDGRLALFDFGLAKLWRMSDDDLDGNETRQLTGNTGSLRYMAPEVALAKPYSHKAEVFSFGTLLWQIASHENPFADCDVSGFFRRVCTLHERPKIPKRFPPELAKLLTRCWKTDQAERPEMAEVIVILRNLLAQLESPAAR